MKKKKIGFKVIVLVIGIVVIATFLFSKKSPRTIRLGEYRNSDW